MANFTSEVKRELFAAPPKDPCCKKAALFALLATGGSYQDGCIEFVSENERLSALFLALAESVYSVRFDIKEAAFDPKRERDRLTFSYAGGESARIAHEAGFSGGRGIAWAAKRECCALSCLKAAFLGGGSCTVPSGVSGRRELHRAGRRDEDGLSPRIRLPAGGGRRGVPSAAASIRPFGEICKAWGAYRRLPQERGYALRLLRCCRGGGGAEKAQRARRRAAGAEQLQPRLQLRGAQCRPHGDRERQPAQDFESLSEPLKEAARARVEHPSESLTELAARLNISKSCLNHRIRKLMELYRSTEENT